MAKVILRWAAIIDLNNIWVYTFEKWSENQADIYYGVIKFACKVIGENSHVGKEYSAIKKDLLGLKVVKHIIFCNLISNEDIEIFRMLHERMDLKNI